MHVLVWVFACVCDPQSSYIMAARVSVMMRGMANAFGLRLRTAPLWLPVAEKLLRQYGIDPTSCTPHRNARLAQEQEAEKETVQKKDVQRS